MKLRSFLKFISGDKTGSLSLKLSKKWLVADGGYDVVKSGRVVARAKILSKELAVTDLIGKDVFFKHNIPILSMCEAAFGDCYRLLLGDNSPRVRVVYDDVGNEILGVCSEAIPGFVDIYMLQQTARWMEQIKWDSLSLQDKELLMLSTEEFAGIQIKVLNEIAKRHEAVLDPIAGKIKLDRPNIIQGLAEIFVASYLFEEDDLHKHNFGVDSQGMLQRIDLGMSFFGPVYAKTRKIHTIPILSASNINWKVSGRDIVNFPILTDATPWYWPTIDTGANLGSLASILGSSKMFTAEDVVLFSSVAKNREFIAAKYRCFLKLLLIPERYFQKAFAAHLLPAILPEVAELREHLISHLKGRLAMLRTTLCQIPEFQEFLSKQEDIELTIKKLVTELQSETTKDGADLMEEINNRYDTIMQDTAHLSSQIDFSK